MKSIQFRIPILLSILIGLLLIGCQEEETPTSTVIDPPATTVPVNNEELVIDQENPPPTTEVVEEASDAEPAEENVEAEEVMAVEEVTVAEDGEAEATAVASVGSTAQHQVEVGEWLMEIARCYGADYAAVREANPHLLWPNMIQPGTTITIPDVGSQGDARELPCVTQYEVAVGDTWSGLAEQFGTTAVILQRANPGPLWAGEKIYVPTTSASVTQ